MDRSFALEAPGRVCLFGEHQDYLGLSVLACGVSRWLRIEARPDPGRRDLLLELPDLGTAVTLDPRAPGPYEGRRDYLRSCLKVVASLGVAVPGGWRFRLQSTIPINAGCGSSSVMCVAWIAALLQAAGVLEGRSPVELARLANQAEVGEFGESGGIMDHLAAACGGLFHLDCRPPYEPEPLAAQLPGLVLIHPGEPKDTTGILKGVKERALAALELAGTVAPGFDLSRATLGEALQVAMELPPPAQRLLRAHARNRALLLEALAELRRPSPDLHRLGEALTEQQEGLREALGISTPGIDRALALARAAGALGGKLNGSGGGGTCFVLAPGREEAVVRALGAARIPAFPIQIAARGVKPTNRK